MTALNGHVALGVCPPLSLPFLICKVGRVMAPTAGSLKDERHLELST